MADSDQLRDQLRTLSIPRDRRPGPSARPRRGPWTAVLAMCVLGLAGYFGWERFGDRFAAWAGRSKAAPAAAVRSVRVVAAPIAAATPVLTATGKIVSDHLVEVQTKVSGQVVALHFEQGDTVERGQVLAEIESDTYRARRDEAAATLEKARANLAFQEVNFDRVRRLHAQSQASDIEFADARRALDEARAQVAADEALLAFAEKLLRDCQVVAPINGVILERNVEVGDFVAAEGGRGAMANAQFGAIADMSKLRVEVDVSELDIRRLRRGMPCLVVPDAHKDRRYRGEVLWIDPGANYAKATVQVKVRIFEPDADLRVEGAAQVQFFTEPPWEAAAEATALRVPLSSVVTDADGTTHVYVARDGRWRRVSVQLGARDAASAEVVSGLNAGDEVAAGDLAQLREGAAVRG